MSPAQKKPATAKSAVEPSTSEAMAAEASPPKKPAGSPPVVPFAALSRRQKAAFFGHFQGVVDQGDKLDSLTAVTGMASPADAATIYTALADIEDALLAIAVDVDVMRAWLEQAPDDALLELLFWYADRFQVGEAKASST